MSKTALYNKKNKAQLLEDLNKEKFSRITVSFYKYTTLTDLEQLRDTLYKDWSKLKILGRIYVAKEGINAQLSIPDYNIDVFKEYLNASNYFLDKSQTSYLNAILDKISKKIRNSNG